MTSVKLSLVLLLVLALCTRSLLKIGDVRVQKLDLTVSQQTDQARFKCIDFLWSFRHFNSLERCAAEPFPSAASTQAAPDRLSGKLVFTRSAAGSDPSQGGDVYVMNADGSHLVRLTTDQHAYEPAWSPDGQQIVFVNVIDQRRNLFTMRADGTHLQQIAHLQNPVLPSWSPDGRQILLNATMPPSNDGIFVMAADLSSAPRALTKADEECLWPRWSPDGKSIVFIKRDADNLYHLFVMNADGTHPIEIQALDGSGASYFYPVWLSDGKHILYETQAGLFKIALDGTGRRLLATPTEGVGSELALSPDEDFVAFSSPTQEMFALALDNSGLTIDLGTGYNPSWTK